MASYTTIQGETWDQAAFRALGSTRHTGALMWKNRQYLDYLTFPAGVVLELQEVKQRQNKQLPPWKQGTL